MDGRNEVASDSDTSSSFEVFGDSSIYFVTSKEVQQSNLVCEQQKNDVSSSSENESDTDGISTLSENEFPPESRNIVQELPCIPQAKTVVISAELTKQTYYKQLGLGIIFIAVLFGASSQFTTEQTSGSLEDVVSDKMQVDGLKIKAEEITGDFDKIVDLTIFCSSKFKKNSQIKRCVESYLGTREVQEEFPKNKIVSEVSENEEIEVKVVKKVKQERNAIGPKGEKLRGFKKRKVRSKQQNSKEVDEEWHSSKSKKRTRKNNWVFDRASIRCKKRNKTFWYYKRVQEERLHDPSFKSCSD